MLRALAAPTFRIVSTDNVAPIEEQGHGCIFTQFSRQHIEQEFVRARSDDEFLGWFEFPRESQRFV